jgi:hypothetical protein
MLERDDTIADGRPECARPGRTDIRLRADGKPFISSMLYKPNYCEELVELMGSGMTLIQVAAHFKASSRTFYNWAAQFPEFGEAMEQGFALREAYLDRLAYNHLEEDFDTKLFIYMKKAEFKRYDTQQANINFNVNQPAEGEKEVKELIDKYIDTKHKETI